MSAGLLSCLQINLYRFFREVFSDASWAQSFIHIDVTMLENRHLRGTVRAISNAPSLRSQNVLKIKIEQNNLERQMIAIYIRCDLLDLSCLLRMCSSADIVGSFGVPPREKAMGHKHPA